MALAATGLLTLVVIVAAGPVSAAQMRRTWHASITGSGGGGSAVLILYTNNSGAITVTMHGLKPLTVYSEMIYKGTCAKPIVLVKLSGLKTNSTGDGTKTTSLNSVNGVAVWSVGPNGTVAFRISTGTWVRCATLKFNVATRVVISKFGIDLPVIHQPDGHYPYCNVAMYVSALSQPGEAGPTMIYAHARTGMFLSLLTASKVNNGKAMLGMVVKVWTSGNKLYTYKVTQVVRHVDVSRLPNNDFTSERLWVQTSEGPRGSRTKLFLIGTRILVAAATAAAAQPKPHIVVCH